MTRRGIALLVVAIAVLVPLGGATASAPTTADDDPVVLVVFHGAECPHCGRMLAFLDDLQAAYPSLEILAYEVWHDEENRQRFVTAMAEHGMEPHSVPTVILDGQVYVGYSGPIADQIESVVADLLAGRVPEAGPAYVVDVPLIGDVDVGSRSMLGATLLIAFVDGVNPCSLWVLSMLLALVVHSRSRTRVVLVGGIFLVVTSVLYGLYMIGAYSTLAVVGREAWIRVLVAVVAGGFGVMHLKEHWTARGPSVTIQQHRKPGIFRRMRRLAEPHRSLPATLGGTVVLAAGVSLLETPCSAGLPLLWTSLLNERDVPASGAVILFVAYLVVFLIDELAIFGAAVVTMRVAKLQEHHGQLLHLVGGTLMVTLAVTMLVAPRALETIAGTLAVFAFAAGACGAVVAAERALHRARPISPT